MTCTGGLDGVYLNLKEILSVLYPPSFFVLFGNSVFNSCDLCSVVV